MKKSIVILLSLALLALCGCGAAAGQTNQSNQEQTEPQTAAEQGTELTAAEPDYGPLCYSYNGYTFGIFDEAEAVLTALGAPMDTFVSESCAYQGNDCFYYYDGVELLVNDVDGVERITGITLADDTVKNPQGLRIGMDIEKALELMDMEYTQSGTVYSFTHGSTLLMLQTAADGSLTAIEYTPALG